MDQNIDKIGYCNSYLKVDTNKIVKNYFKVKNYVGANVGVIPVLKGNAYGYGLVPIAKIFEDRCRVEILANSAVYEAVELREAEVQCDIVIIGGVPQHLIPAAVQYNLQIPLFEKITAKNLNHLAERAGVTIKVHIKIETGMNRLGVKPGQELSELLSYVDILKNIEIVGAYTHFATSTADYDDAFALEQYEVFQQGVEQIKDRGIRLKYIHCCNSAAMAWFKEAYGTHVRSCSSVLGHMAMEDGREPIGLEEPVEIRSFITNIHNVDPGESVGYSRYFKVEKPMKVATISLGFADGFYPMWMRGQAPVLVNGKRTRFLGCCMDQSFVDVTEVPCEIGQSVTLIGRDGEERITTWEIEQFTGNTFEYLFGTIGPRVARIYV
ncbi:MAG: alanine racemase [Thiohalomonadaceae bacterium]